MKQSEILYAAADYIRTHGWLRGEAGDHVLRARQGSSTR